MSRRGIQCNEVTDRIRCEQDTFQHREGRNSCSDAHSGRGTSASKVSVLGYDVRPSRRWVTYRAPIAPLRAASRETNPGLGVATAALFPALWRFWSDAILMRKIAPSNRKL